MPKKSAKKKTKRKELEKKNPKELSNRLKTMKDFAERGLAEAMQDSIVIEYHSQSRLQRIKDKLKGNRFLVGPDWQYVGPGTPELDEKAKSLPGFNTPVSKVAGLYEDGLYRSKTYPGMDIYLKDGVAKCLSKGYDFETQVEALFDFLAIGKSTHSFEFDYDSVDQCDEGELRKIIAIAEKRGYTLEFGPNIQQFLLSNKASFSDDYVSGYAGVKTISDEAAQQRRTDIYKLLNDANANAAQKLEDLGIKDKADHYRYKLFTDAITAEKKVGNKDVDNNDHRAEITKAAYEEDKDPEKHADTPLKKIEVARSELVDIQDRLKQLDEAKRSLDNDLETWKKRFEDAETLTDPAQKGQKSKSEYKAELVEKYEKADKERAALMEAIEGEHSDLIKRRQFWKGEIEEIATREIRPRDDADTTPKSDLEKAVDGAKKELAKTEKKSKELGEKVEGEPLAKTAHQKTSTKLNKVYGTYLEAKNDPAIQKAQQARTLQA